MLREALTEALEKKTIEFKIKAKLPVGLVLEPSFAWGSYSYRL
jgi:hypothetical protein